jgi:hypothetical protein
LFDVASVDPSFTTIVSIGLCVWLKQEVTASLMNSAALYAGITTVTLILSLISDLKSSDKLHKHTGYMLGALS